MDKIYTDILICGTGLAGVKAAYAASLSGQKVTLISKSSSAASDYVLGYNAAVSEKDSTELFIKDTLKGGYGINSEGLVKKLAENSAKEVMLDEKNGLSFDKDEGGFDLLKPLGCSQRRLVHIGNKTGKISLEKYTALLKEKNAEFFENMMLADINVTDGVFSGAYLLDLKNKREVFAYAKALVIASGGIHIAQDSTYPQCFTGDGCAAAYRAGCTLTDLEFIQFEPCRCIYPKKLGLSTTLLAKGGKITNSKGERFLLKYAAKEGDIQKDKLARYIFEEIHSGNGSPHGGVYLDLTDIPKAEITEKHSLYHKRFLNEGIDITKDIIEVAPCAHSYMGGIVIDENCRTDVSGIFAAGEVTGGVHGANRIGGNAGTEINVFGSAAGIAAVKYAERAALKKGYCPEETVFEGNAEKARFEELKKTVRQIMADGMGPVRCEKELMAAKERLQFFSSELKKLYAMDFDAFVSKKECENLLLICECAVSSAIKRKESRGVHFRSDYPLPDEKFRKNFKYSIKEVTYNDRI